MTDRARGHKSAYDLLKRAILDGAIEPGAKLVETALAERFTVSRTPIREALNRLEQDGLVERAPRGYIVRERSLEEVLDLYESRALLEGYAGRVAAERRTDHDLLQLSRITDRAGEVDVRSEAAMNEHRQAFRQALWRATHHETLLDLLHRLDVQIGQDPVGTLAQPGRWDESLTEQAELLAAIATRDSDQAEAVAHRHFARDRAIRLELAFPTAQMPVRRPRRAARGS